MHPNYKKKILAAKDIDTIVTGKRLGHPVRTLKNKFSRRFYEMEYDSTISDEEIEAFGAGSLRKAAREGDVAEGGIMCGQCASMIKEESTSREIILSMFEQAEEILANAGQYLK